MTNIIILHLSLKQLSSPTDLKKMLQHIDIVTSLEQRPSFRFRCLPSKRGYCSPTQKLQLYK